MVIFRTHFVVLFISLSTFGGCASINQQSSYDRMKNSAKIAATSKHTWIPLIGAALFAIDDFDEQTSEWASEHNPLFGDIEHAKDWSDTLTGVAGVNWLVTAMIAPTDKVSRCNRLLRQSAAWSANYAVTSGLKSGINKSRPNRPDKDDSFPSSHTSSAVGTSTLAAQNIAEMNLSASAKRAWTWGAYSTAGLAAWSRVEGNRHYPSDVLFGYSLGRFVTSFLNHWLVEPSDRDSLAFAAEPAAEDGFVVSVNYSF